MRGIMNCLIKNGATDKLIQLNWLGAYSGKNYDGMIGEIKNRVDQRYISWYRIVLSTGEEVDFPVDEVEKII